MIRSFRGTQPSLDPSAWVDATALVVGDVVLGAEVSVWPMSVIRGDVNEIRIGARTNVQDGTVIHGAHAGGVNPTGYPVHIGEDVTIGHRSVVHACTVGDACLIGMSSTVMDGAVLEDEVILGAASLVPPGKRLVSGYLYMGSPVRRQRPLTDEERAFLRYSSRHYAEVARQHRQDR